MYVHAGIVYQEVKGEFDKLKKAVRAGGRANSSGPTLDTDTHLHFHAAPFLDTPSSVNQHGHLSSQSSGQHSISLQSSKSPHNVPDNLPLTFNLSENGISHHPISDNGPISQFMVCGFARWSSYVYDVYKSFDRSWQL